MFPVEEQNKNTRIIRIVDNAVVLGVGVVRVILERRDYHVTGTSRVLSDQHFSVKNVTVALGISRRKFFLAWIRCITSKVNTSAKCCSCIKIKFQKVKFKTVYYEPGVTSPANVRGLSDDITDALETELNGVLNLIFENIIWQQTLISDSWR